MNKLAILALPLLLIFSGKIYAAQNTTVQQVKVEQGSRCSTVILNNPKSGQLISATTTCPGTETAPGTVTKVFPNGKTTVLQNGQIINL